MLLLMTSACSLTLIVLAISFYLWENYSKYGSHTLKIQQTFHVLFVGRIVAGEIPIFRLVSVTETSFLSSKNVMFSCMACSSALKARVKTLHGKWNSQTFSIGYLNQVVRQTNRFSVSSVVTYFPLIIYFSVTCTKYIKNRFMCPR